MKHDHHAGTRVIGPDKFGTIRRGFVLMRDRDDLLIEWDDRSNTWFMDDEVAKLCREEKASEETT